MANERTPPPYPTHGPDGDGGVSWHEYFAELRERRAGDNERSGQLDESPDVLLVGHGEWDVGNDELQPNSLLVFVKSLVKAGFRWKAYWYTTFEEGQPYGVGAKKYGEKHPDRTVDTILLCANKHGYGWCYIEFQRANAKNWTCSWRQINGQLRPVSDKEMKEWINGASD